MSTIAWDGITLAADSLVSDGETLFTHDAKKIRKNVGVFDAVGITGDWGAAQEMFEVLSRVQSLESPLFIETMSPDINLVVMTEGHLIEIICTKREVSKCRVEWKAAWGSGHAYAVAAMDFGKTSQEAVKYASTKDPFTNSKVVTIRKPV